MKVYVFDLDDTLYEEITYVHSGFRAVARDLEAREGVDAFQCEQKLRDALNIEGRGKVFDTVLESFGLLTRGRVGRCLAVYRGHQPSIVLSEDARDCLERLHRSGMPVYIVTDGNKLVQLAKLRALGLYDSPLVRRCFISRRFGVHNEKPSPYCFGLISELEGASPRDIVYVGDNPAKDFVGIKPLGYRTVRIRRGSHREVTMPPSHEADFSVEGFEQFEGRLESYIAAQREGGIINGY
ncbi:HAD family hydrolase [Cohnella rhizosphaerae]|uniref:HAD family hydrolase n=1 Tax=Cohnella rhizosphaerae TaxID=1457232 RepID=A0A9X4KW73_9BACL|nr:HAD family hydrolase [Cohnella rhizosphaerae]MDG0811893.1 HAD family hydrolase [Cohnella rhizosphaerae]